MEMDVLGIRVEMSLDAIKDSCKVSINLHSLRLSVVSVFEVASSL